MAKLEYYWHIHHDVLCEGTTDIEERIRYINGNNKADEIPLRLKLMVKVKNPSKLPKEWREADTKCNEANAKWMEVEAKWREAYAEWEEAYVRWSEAAAKWREADAKRREAYAEWREVEAKWREAYAKYLPQIEKLHKKEHPDCPWDGSTIFTLVN